MLSALAQGVHDGTPLEHLNELNVHFRRVEEHI